MRWSLSVFLQNPLPPLLKNLNCKSHIWSNNSTPGPYSKGRNAYIHIDYVSVHTGSIHKAKFWKEKKWPVIVNRQTKYNNPHTVGNYLATKEKEKKLLTMTGRNIKNILSFL